MFTSIYRLALVGSFLLPLSALAQDEKSRRKLPRHPLQHSKNQTIEQQSTAPQATAEASPEAPEPVAPFAESLAKAKQALITGKADEALTHLDEAEQLAPASTSILTPSELSAFGFIAEWLKLLKGVDPLETWRKGLTIHPSQEWQSGLIKAEQEEQSRDIYLALRDEVHNKSNCITSNPREVRSCKVVC